MSERGKDIHVMATTLRKLSKRMHRPVAHLSFLIAATLIAYFMSNSGIFRKIKDAANTHLGKLDNQQGPSASNAPYNNYQQQNNMQIPIASQQGFGKMNVAYKIPAQSISHVLYAFADVREDGEVFLTDSWADVEIHYEGDSWNDSGKNLYGCFKQLLLLKKKYRHLKLLLSIGGWTYSSHFAAVKTAEGRSRFVSSAMKVLEDVGLDGLDIDWEYPKNSEEAQQYVMLLAELRSALNTRSHAVQGRHWLSIAAPCGEQMKTLNVRALDQYLDMWNLMAYDFSGTWSQRATHQANLLPTQNTDASVDAAIRFYTSQGVPPWKLVMGMPLYARAFANTDGLGCGFQGVPEGGAEPGNFYYNDLPLPGHSEQYDNQAHATFSTHSSKREFASYEGPISVDSKVTYIHEKGLAGTMWWELSGDCSEEKGGMQRALIPRAAYSVSLPAELAEDVRKRCANSA